VRRESLLFCESGNVGLIWLVVFIGVFTTVVAYLFTYQVVNVYLYEGFVGAAPANVSASYFGVASLVRVVYKIFPWIIIIGLILWGFLASQKEEFEEGF
jgi:hypothetical protein